MFVIVASGWCEGERNRVEQLMSRRLQDQVRVTVVEMDCLHRTPRGKLWRVANSRQIEACRNQAQGALAALLRRIAGFETSLSGAQVFWILE